MAAWLISYWVTIGKLIETDHGEAARVGATIGASIGTGAILFLWAFGAIILGLLTYFSRGKKVILEGDDQYARHGGVRTGLVILAISLIVTAIVGTLFFNRTPPAGVNSPVTTGGTRLVADESRALQSTTSSTLVTEPLGQTALTQREQNIIDDARSAEKVLGDGIKEMEKLINSGAKSSQQYLEVQRRFDSLAEALSQERKLLKTITPSSQQYEEAQRLINFFENAEKEIKTAIEAWPKPSTTAWVVTQEKSKIDDSTNVYLQSHSNETIRNQFGELTSLELWITCREKRTDLYIVFGGHFMASIESYGTVTYRIDKRPPVNRQFTESTDHKALGLWRGQSIPFIKEMFDASTLLVRATPYNESAVTGEFNISGLKEVVRPLRIACGWADSASLAPSHEHLAPLRLDSQAKSPKQ